MNRRGRRGFMPGGVLLLAFVVWTILIQTVDVRPVGVNISGHSSKESQAAYRALGCTPAEEINASLAAEEPFDVQLEYRL